MNTAEFIKTEHAAFGEVFHNKADEAIPIIQRFASTIRERFESKPFSEFTTREMVEFLKSEVLK